MADKKPVILDHKSKSAIPPASTLLSTCFADDPAFRLLLSKPRSPNLLDSRSFRDQLFKAMTMLFINSGCTVTSISPAENSEQDSCTTSRWPTVGIFEPPGGGDFKIGSLGSIVVSFIPLMFKAGIYRTSHAFNIYYHTIRTMKNGTFNRKTIRKRDFYSIAFLGTLPEYRGNGLGAAFLRQVQNIARNHRNKKGELEPKAVWLESSSEDSRRLYERVGFQVMAVESGGAGVMNVKGYRIEELEAQGEHTNELPGVTVWGMVWWPDEDTKKRHCV